MMKGFHVTDGNEDLSIVTTSRAKATGAFIAPPGAVCQVCHGGCVGELVEAAPGPNNTVWYVHADYTVCALVALFTYGRVERT